MYTRKQYMNKECSHADYYNQFVDNAVKQRVLMYITKPCIIKSKDPYFNDIALSKWDVVLIPFPKYIGDKMRACGDFPTLSSAVCIAKAAAQIIRMEAV